MKTASIIQEKLDTSHAWKRQSSYHHHHHHQERITCGNTEETKFYQHHNEAKSGESGKLNKTSNGAKSNNAYKESYYKGSRTEQKNGGGPVVVCYGCGKQGHKRSSSPLKVNRIAAYNRPTLLSLDGAIGARKSKLTLDSGAQISVVSDGLVDDGDYTGESI